jgi:uncharacterized protein YndB with AHSA1/START domain
MNIDIASQLSAIHRQVEQQPPADGSGESVSVLMRCRYDAPIGDVWDAVTQPDRIKRWFMPISGELRAGGTFQLEGNAGGDILSCEPPRLLKVTFGAPTSIVEVRLTPQGDSDTVLELEHTVPIEMAQSGAGALYVGARVGRRAPGAGTVPGWRGRRRPGRSRELSAGAGVLQAVGACLGRGGQGLRHRERRAARRGHRGLPGAVRPRPGNRTTPGRPATRRLTGADRPQLSPQEEGHAQRR